MGFSRQVYWSGLPFLSPGNLPEPGIKPRSPSLLHWQILLPLHHLRSLKWAEEPNRHFSKEDVQMTNSHRRRYLILLTIKEVETKTTMRYHFRPVSWPLLKKKIWLDFFIQTGWNSWQSKGLSRVFSNTTVQKHIGVSASTSVLQMNIQGWFPLGWTDWISWHYGFSSGHVWMWELDYKESWAHKTWCFWTVVLEKTLESPLDCKEIQPVHSKGDQPLGFLWKEWCWSWNSSTLATSCEELTHWKRLWCWEGLRAGREGDDRGWDGWMALLTRWTWVWVNSRSWWWTGRPGMLQFMGSQRVGHDWATELNWTELIELLHLWLQRKKSTWFHCWPSGDVHV